MAQQPTPDVAEKFWARVERGDGCWRWTRSTKPYGYGKFRVGDKAYRAHRFAWELTHGPVPLGLVVMHICDNRACVRPDHLQLGTVEDNNADMVLKGRQARGTDLPQTRLSDDDVAAIRARHVSGERFSERSTKAIARDYGVCVSAVRKMVAGKYRREPGEPDAMTASERAEHARELMSDAMGLK